ncbi:MAG: hypothetical protein LBK42_06240 [Propionibacteriaceae bacterium]|jgi:hypothetical protein|nr:hypothetical protein [Propionibacteriaceae bacterium]
MAEVSINIEVLRELIRGLESAKTNGSGAATDLLKYTSEAGVEVSGLRQWAGGSAYEQLEDLIVWYNRALAIAEDLAASTPGFGAGTPVVFDDSLVPDTSMREVEAAVDRVMAALGNWSGQPGESLYVMTETGDVPQVILDELAANRSDPYFAAQLARRLTPERLAGFLWGLNSTIQLKADQQRSGLEGAGPGLTQFAVRYDQLLTDLGDVLGRDSRATGRLADPDLARRWGEAIGGKVSTAGANLLSLVIARGTWSVDFLSAVKNYATTRQEADPDHGAGLWGLGQDYGGEVFDPRYVLIDPANPDDVQFNQVTSPWPGLFAAAARTPEAVANWFAGPDRIEVPLPDGGSTTINRQLWDFIHTGLDEAAATATLLAVLSVAQDDPPELWRSRLLDDVAALPQALQEESRLWEETNPTWKRVLHLLADVVGMFFDPVDAAHGVWYAAEGDWGDAAGSLLSVVPALGMFPAGRKIIKNLRLLGAATSLKVWRNVNEFIPPVEDFVKAVELAPYTPATGRRLTYDSLQQLTAMSTVNPNASFVVLGSYSGPGKPDWTSSYEQIGHYTGGTYFNMGQAYDKIHTDLVTEIGEKAADKEMWSINRQFLDDQIKQGKPLYFTVDPEKMPSDSGTAREWAYIQDRLGGNVTLEKIGDCWAVVTK